MRLLQGERVSPEAIFIGTFTRAIAAELSEALEVSTRTDELGQDHAAVQISTLHALALRLIRQHPTARPGRTLRFLLNFEKEVMLYDLGETLTGFPKQADRRKELNRVCAAWAEGTDLKLAGFLGKMDRWLRRYQGMLIDEVVQLARIGLESGDIPTGIFDHVIIDEYQDLTAAEQRLVETIWSRNGSLVVLGDDDQSIYSFRFNHPGGISEFFDRWKDDSLTDLGIPDNRRCGRVIVDLANAMTAAAGTTKPPMISKRGEEGELALLHWPSVGKEIGGLSRYIKARSNTNFLVLVPRRFFGYRLKAAIGDDAQTSFHEEVLELPVVQERFALACLVANPSDAVALRTLLGFHRNGVEHGPKRNAQACRTLGGATVEGISLLEAIARGEIKVSGPGSRHLRTRADTVLTFFAELGSDPDLEDVVHAIFHLSVAQGLADQEKHQKARSDLELLRNAALEIQEQLGEADLSKILDHLRFRIAMRIPLTEPSDVRVRIMTLHGAKGLEADVVILAGVADQIIPGKSPRDPVEAEQLREEQRRLLYVSVTRAKRELIISWPKSMEYKDATKNHVRVDQVWRRADKQQIVRLGRTALLPDVAQQPQTGQSWLKEKLIK